jgi:hypothetical protein
MYKKLLIATAVAAVSTNSFAATWAGGTTVVMPTHTNEGMEDVLDTTGVASGNALIRLGAEYVVNDLIKFTYSKAKATGSNWPTTMKTVADVAFTGTATVEDAAAAKGDATIIVDRDSGGNVDGLEFTVGRQFTIANDTTNYRVTSQNTTQGVIGITPVLAQNAANGAVITEKPISELTLTLTTASATAAEYRVSASANGTTTVGSLLAAPVITFDEDGLQGSTVTVGFSAATAGGTAMDTLATTTLIATGKPQWTKTVTGFDGIVDVAAAKKKFTGGATTDAVSVKIVESDGVAGSGIPAVDNTNAILTYTGTVTAEVATVTSGSTTISGDWNFLDDTAATAGTQVSIGSTATDEFDSTAGCTTAVSTAGVLTITDPLTSDANCTTTFKNVPAAVLPVQGYTATTTFTYTPVSTVRTRVDAAAAAGAWGLNGTTIRAYGVPMGSHVSRFIWINNKGTLDGAFTYTAMMNGASYGPYALTTVPAKKAVSVAALIDTDLAARGITIAPSSRATFSFAAPVPQADVVVSAAYKHVADADRVALETSALIMKSAKKNPK